MPFPDPVPRSAPDDLDPQLWAKSPVVERGAGREIFIFHEIEYFRMRFRKRFAPYIENLFPNRIKPGWAGLSWVPFNTFNQPKHFFPSNVRIANFVVSQCKIARPRKTTDAKNIK